VGWKPAACGDDGAGSLTARRGVADHLQRFPKGFSSPAPIIKILQFNLGGHGARGGRSQGVEDQPQLDAVLDCLGVCFRSRWSIALLADARRLRLSGRGVSWDRKGAFMGSNIPRV